MNTTNDADDAADDLTAAYRRAGAIDGSRPSAATRAAILAEAGRLTANPSAANDSWWSWKAAASIAVLGLAGVLAVRTFRSEPVVPWQPPVPTAATTSVVAQTAPPLPHNESASATTTVADKAVNTAAAPTDVRREQASAIMAAAPAAELALPVEKLRKENTDGIWESDAAVAPQRGKSEIGAVQSTVATSGAPVIASERALLRRAAPSTATLELMERYFPAEFGSSAPDRRPWILFDQQGQVLRTGTADWNRSSKLELYLEQSFPGIKIGAGAAGSVQNNKGQSADYSFFWLAADSAPLTAAP
jgi:hypothetical protein